MRISRYRPLYLFLRLVLLYCIAFTGNSAYAAKIVLNEKDASVWLPAQTVSGTVTGAKPGSVTVYCNNVAHTVAVNADDTFSIALSLNSGANSIYATFNQNRTTVKSAVLTLTLGYQPVPVVKPYATVNSANKASLNVTVVDNPGNASLKYTWSVPKSNPGICILTSPNSSETTITVPAANGVYYINVQVKSGADSATYKTYIIRNNGSLHAFDLNADHAAWIDSAVVYEINPSIFVKNGTYNAITSKLAEIKSLGVNTLWIQPIYQTDDYEGQGYSITDYFSVRTDIGTEAQLDNLIATAKQLHFRIIFDFVPNHTSINHPYAQDCIKNGKNSHYYSFYQHVNDGKPYSSYYLYDSNGMVSYFYKNLVNLDYNNPEVQEWMIQAIKYWLLKYDLDGYRFDSMWGVNARTPAFGQRLNTELKSIKPGLLLLAEEKSCDQVVYKNGFDAAYDWAADTTWISQWAWAVKYDATKSYSIFNTSVVANRSPLLQAAIFKDSSVSNRSLRFIENNDQPRFIANHTLSQTKLAAALIFSVPGLPMIYNGQEIGCTSVPYTTKTIFTADKTIKQLDSPLFNYYQKIIQLHSQTPVLLSPSISPVTLTGSNNMMAFRRWQDTTNMLVIVNLAGSAAKATIQYSNAAFLNGASYAQDILSGNVYTLTAGGASMQIPMVAYGIRWLLIGKTPIVKKPEIAAVKQVDDGITVHKAVSPNYDGINDFLQIDGIEAYPKNSLLVVNSSGAKVFEASGYNNSSRIFDGHSSVTGAMVPGGTYFYILQYNVGGQLRSKNGFFILKY